jgi:hypothetical protein
MIGLYPLMQRFRRERLHGHAQELEDVVKHDQKVPTMKSVEIFDIFGYSNLAFLG